MKSTKGNFILDKDGKVVFKPSKKGRWELVHYPTKLDNNFTNIGIDPFEPK